MHAQTYIVILVPFCHRVCAVRVCDRAGCVSVCGGDKARHDWQGTVGGQHGLGSAIQRQRGSQGGLYYLQVLERKRE